MAIVNIIAWRGISEHRNVASSPHVSSNVCSLTSYLRALLRARGLIKTCVALINLTLFGFTPHRTRITRWRIIAPRICARSSMRARAPFTHNARRSDARYRAHLVPAHDLLRALAYSRLRALFCAHRRRIVAGVVYHRNIVVKIS